MNPRGFTTLTHTQTDRSILRFAVIGLETGLPRLSCSQSEPENMAFILDEGGVFDVPLEKIWKLNRSTTFHKHPSLKDMKAERTADPSTVFLTWESEVQGVTFQHKAKLLFLPPIGFTMDFVEGPLAGSRDFEYYTPMGDKTGITCVGDWKRGAGGLSDDQLRALVKEFYDEAFREDKENLDRMTQRIDPPTLYRRLHLR